MTRRSSAECEGEIKCTLNFGVGLLLVLLTQLRSSLEREGQAKAELMQGTKIKNLSDTCMHMLNPVLL